MTSGNGLKGEKKSVEMDASETEGDWGGNESKGKYRRETQAATERERDPGPTDLA